MSNREKIKDFKEFISSLGFIDGKCRVVPIYDNESHDEFDKMIRTEYFEQFFPNGSNIDIAYKGPETRLYAIEIYECSIMVPIDKMKEPTKLGYFIISDKKEPLDEKFLDRALYPKYIGIGLFKFIMPFVVHLAYSIGISELYSWTRNAKIHYKDYGYYYVDSYQDSDLYCCNVNKYLNNLYLGGLKNE